MKSFFHIGEKRTLCAWTHDIVQTDRWHSPFPWTCFRPCNFSRLFSARIHTGTIVVVIRLIYNEIFLSLYRTHVNNASDDEKQVASLLFFFLSSSLNSYLSLIYAANVKIFIGNSSALTALRAFVTEVLSCSGNAVQVWNKPERLAAYSIGHRPMNEFSAKGSKPQRGVSNCSKQKWMKTRTWNWTPYLFFHRH